MSKLMNKDRLKKLAGITENKTPVPTKVTLQVPRVKMTDELDFKKLLKEHGLTATIDSNKSVATVVAELDTKTNSENKLLEFVNEWLNKDVPKSDVKLLESTFTEISDVIRAVDDGQKVFWKTPDYVVGKDLYGDYHITYRPWSKAPNTVALTDHYNAEDFMVSEALEVIQDAVVADELASEDTSEPVVEGDNNNFIQPDDVSPDTLNNRMGVDKERKEKVTIPADVKSSITKRISELKTSIEMYDKKGYNDHSQKEKAIDCLEQILDNLSTNDLEGLKKAQIFFETLMSPITDLFPSKLVNWLAKSVPSLVKESEEYFNPEATAKWAEKLKNEKGEHPYLFSTTKFSSVRDAVASAKDRGAVKGQIVKEGNAVVEAEDFIIETDENVITISEQVQTDDSASFEDAARYLGVDVSRIPQLVANGVLQLAPSRMVLKSSVVALNTKWDGESKRGWPQGQWGKNGSPAQPRAVAESFELTPESRCENCNGPIDPTFFHREPSGFICDKCGEHRYAPDFHEPTVESVQLSAEKAAPKAKVPGDVPVNGKFAIGVTKGKEDNLN